MPLIFFLSLTPPLLPHRIHIKRLDATDRRPQSVAELVVNRAPIMDMVNWTLLFGQPKLHARLTNRLTDYILLAP